MPPTVRAGEDKGVAIFFSGLSGAGKSTLAAALRTTLEELGRRNVKLLDDDMFRFSLSSEHDYAVAFRLQNIVRIAVAAAEMTRSGGIALCCTIGPIEKARQRARQIVEGFDLQRFMLVYLSTPLETCEQRDRMGLYRMARNGSLPCLTGITDDYETPLAADLVIDTTDTTIPRAVEQVISYLRQQKLI